MTDNVFAPPKSNLDAPRGEGEVAPPLWNPNAAATWSLFLSSAFGAYLHMRNWRALGEHRLANQARLWMAGSVAVYTLTIFFASLTLADNTAPRLIGIALLITWYLIAARAQVRYVKERFGDTYPRRGWLVPLVLGFVILVFLLLAIVLIAAAIRVAVGAR